jgi:hypothetical protein
LNATDAARVRNGSDRALAARLEQIEILLDLHSAGMNPKAARLLLERVQRVRRALELRSERDERVRRRIALLRHDQHA